VLTRDRASAALTPPAIRPGRGGSRAGFGSLALALALAALGQSTGPPTMAAPRAASRAASLPPYDIEALRARRYPGGRLALGAPLRRGTGFTVYRLSWPSGGQTMTGSLEIPTGRGPSTIWPLYGRYQDAGGCLSWPTRVSVQPRRAVDCPHSSALTQSHALLPARPFIGYTCRC
jgi:hypothetical protein